VRTFKLIGFLIFIIFASGNFGCKDGTIDFGRSAQKISKMGKKQLKKQRKSLLRRKKGDPTDGRVPLEQYRVKQDLKVVGVEPNWSLRRDGELHFFHYYNLLTTLVVGEYDINPLTGLPRYGDALYEPITNGMIDMAIDDNPAMEIFTKVTMHGDFGANPHDRQANARLFFRAEEIHQAFVDSIYNHVELLSEIFRIRNLSRFGALLSFRNVPAANTNDFVALVRKMKSQGGNMQIMLELPSEFAERRFYNDELVAGISQYVDHYLLKAYPFYLPDTPSSISIVHSDGLYDVARTLDYYVSIGIPRNKISLEFPQHGVVWERQGDLYRISPDRPYIPVLELHQMIRSDRVNWEEAPPPVKYMHDGMGSAYYTFSDGRVAVFENDSTLQRKYAWLRDSAKVGGIGLENLSYMSDIQDETVWRIVAEEYGVVAQRLGRAILAFVMLFMIGGIVLSNVKYWEVRNIVAKETMHKLYQLLAVVIFFVTFAWAVGWISTTVALVLAAIPILFILYRRMKKKMKRYV